MADISKHAPHPVVQAIYQSYVDKREPAHRPHLGGSQIGHHCDRFLWYQFRWAAGEDFSGKGRLLRLFDHGKHEERRLIDDLRATGATIYPVDPETGRQWTFTAFGGHFGLSLDATGKGFPDTDAWRLLEFKTANDKSFNELLKKGVADWNPQYYAQVIVGMELSGLKKCLHITVNKNTDEIYAESIKPNSTGAKRLLDRAERIIFANEPPERCSDDPSWWQCKMCPMYDICHGKRVAEVNMRTCVHATPTRDGRWKCEKCGQYKTTEEQRQPCTHHLMRPDLVPYAKAVEAGDDWIKYEGPNGTFYNTVAGVHDGPNCYTSQEMRDFDGVLPIPEEAEKLRTQYTGKVVELTEIKDEEWDDIPF